MSKIKASEFFNSPELINSNYWTIIQHPTYRPLDMVSYGNDLSDIVGALDEKTVKMDLIYLRMSTIWSECSKCNRMQVGCLMVIDKSIISNGYNGSPHGFPNVCEDENNNTLPYVLHAEANAITKLAKSTLSSDGSTIYVTVSPCYECSKLIIQSGVKRLVIKDLYRKTDSIPFLCEAGVEITRIGVI